MSEVFNLKVLSTGKMEIGKGTKPKLDYFLYFYLYRQMY